MSINLQAVAFVKNTRTQVEDDQWGTVLSEIALAEHIPTEAFEGITDFSHLHILFYMDKVSEKKAVAQYRHPRNNKDFPKVGTFAQRNKSRPNKIGLTTVTLVERNGRSITVRHLDAIDGTPVLDIKPVMREFQPKGTIQQPDWATEIMANYW